MSTATSNPQEEHARLLSTERRNTLSATTGEPQSPSSSLAFEPGPTESIHASEVLDSSLWLAWLAEGREGAQELTTSHANYMTMVEGVFALRDELEVENDERLRPFPVALIGAFKELYRAYRWWTAFPTSVASARVFPVGNIVPYDEGGLRIEWRAAPQKYVRLLVSPDGTSRVYYEFDAEYDVDPDATSLGRWLQRL
jgi:hypothetical protein